VTTVTDSGGVLGISLGRGAHGDHPTVLIRAILEDELVPLATALASLLEGAEAYGRAAVDLWLTLPKGENFHEQQVAGVPRELRVGRELTVPAEEEEVRALALSWHRELQRASGIAKYEGEPATSD
jgi:hypothetical protein